MPGPRKLREYDIETDWNRIRIRVASKPASIRIFVNGAYETLFEPRFCEDHRKAELYGSTMVPPSFHFTL